MLELKIKGGTVLMRLSRTWLGWLTIGFLAAVMLCSAAPANENPFRLLIDGSPILYPGDERSITAEVYDDTLGWLRAGTGVDWGQTNDSAGTYTYQEDTLKYAARPSLPLPREEWDSVSTVVYATYSVGSSVYRAEIPLFVYPEAAREDPVKRVLVWLRSQQQETGQLNEWAVIGIAAAGENPVGPAWQRNGKSHLDFLAEYLRDQNKKDEYFRALTDYARVTLAVAAAAYYDEAWRAKLRDFAGINLVQVLKESQNPADGHFGKDQESKLVNAHVWTILALKAAGQEIPNAEKAKSWLLNAQNSDGGWGYTTDTSDQWGGYLSDSNDTADAVRALIALGETDKGKGTPLRRALDFLRGCQADDGGFVWSPLWGGAGDASSDARVILALRAAGEDPLTWVVNGENPVRHLLSLQTPAGFFLYQPDLPAWDPLSLAGDALAALAGVPLLELPPPAKPPGGGTSGPRTISVTVGVLGVDGAVMYPRQTVQLGPGEQNALGALLKLVGRDRVQTAYGDAYVVAIGNLREKAYGPTSGWCYRVDGTIPPVPAKDYPLKDGAEVEWFYVRSVSEAGGGAGRGPGQEQQTISVVLKPSPQAQEVLEKLAQVLGLAPGVSELGPVEGVGKAVAVVGTGKPLSFAERVAAKKELQANHVDLVQKVAADRETTLADAGAELVLVIPAGALARDVEVRVREIRQPGEVPPLPPGFRLVSSPYDCGPEGTTFKVPATLSLRLVVPPVVKPENLVLARYDRKSGTWSAIPAVVDLAKGLLVARVRHFSILAVLAREARASFADMTGDSSWARDAVELLGGAGILKGVHENRFEPAREVTRAEATVMLVRALGLPSPSTRPAFRDVRENDWYAGELAAAASAGLVTGYEDGTFRPDRPIAREELVTVLARALNLSGGKGASLPFADAGTVAAWARDGVAAAVSAGLVRGYPDGTFRPGNPITRAECAVLVYRALAE